MKRRVAALLIILPLMTAGTAFSAERVKIGYLRFQISLPAFVAIVKKDSPLKELRELKGKRVGTYSVASSVELARAIIRTQMDP